MDNDDKSFAKVFGGFIFVWVFSALASLGFLAVVIWAIIKLVNHFAG